MEECDHGNYAADCDECIEEIDKKITDAMEEQGIDSVDEQITVLLVSFTKKVLRIGATTTEIGEMVLNAYNKAPEEGDDAA